MYIIHDYLNPYSWMKYLSNESLFFAPIAEFTLSSILCIFPFFMSVHISIFGLLIKLGYIGYFLEKVMPDTIISRSSDRANRYFNDMLEYVFSNNNTFDDLKRKLIAANYYYLCKNQSNVKSDTVNVELNRKWIQAKKYIAIMHNSKHINNIKLKNMRQFKLPITNMNTKVFIYIAMNIFSAIETLYVLQSWIIISLEMELIIMYHIQTVFCFLYIFIKLQVLRHAIYMFWSCFLIYHILPNHFPQKYYPKYYPESESSKNMRTMWDIMYFHQKQCNAILDAGVCHDIAIVIHQYLIYPLPVDSPWQDTERLIKDYTIENIDTVQ